MLKKFVSTVVGVSCAVAALGVSATSPTIQTTTTYSGEGTAKIAVTTTVTDAASGNVYTYLAYDQGVTTVENGEQIVYVDQQTATGRNVTFNYVTDSTDIGSNVKVGGKSAEGVAYTPASGTIPAVPGNVSVTVDSGEAVKTVVDTNVADGTYVKVAYDASNPAKTVLVNGEAVDWFAGDGFVWVKVNALKVENPTVAITTASATIEAQTLASGYLAAGNTEATTEDKSAVIALGQVTGNVAEYGIAFSTDSNFTSPQYLKALGRNNEGQFAIKLVDYASVFLNSTTVYAQVYYKAAADGTETRTGAVYQLAVGGDDNGRGTVVE